MIELDNISMTYAHEAGDISIFSGLSVDFKAGDLVSIVGRSGCGKTTLMNILGLMMKPSAGRYWFAGADVSQLTSDQAAAYRNRSIGMVFQGFHLLPNLTAQENVALPLLYSGKSTTSALARAREVLAWVDLADRLTHKPSELSGGQKQRVAIARAIVNRPALLLADEPTGALDVASAKQVLSLFFRLGQEFDMAVVAVTHDMEIASAFTRCLVLQEGGLLPRAAKSTGSG